MVTQKEMNPMYNILICDDQTDIVNALKIYLAPEGYRLFEAFTGDEALKIVKEQNIHLVLMDIRWTEAVCKIC